MTKTFPGEASELDSLTAQRSRGHTKTAPDVMPFGYWMDKPRTKAINRRADSGRRQRSPVTELSGKKQKHRIPMSKTFPGEASELDSLTIKAGRSWGKDAAKVLPFPAPVR